MKYTLLFIILLYLIYFIIYNKHANEEFINVIDYFNSKKDYADILYKNPLNLSGGINVQPELKGKKFNLKALKINNILIDKKKLKLITSLPFTCPGARIYSETCQGGCKDSSICLNDQCIDDEKLKHLNTFWPIGTIIAYFNILKDSSGNSKIPEGWAICDGTKGTPDLRDKFIVGAGGEYNLGEKGGAKNVTLDRNQVPNHSHKFATLGGRCIGARDLKPTERNRLSSGVSSLINSYPHKRDSSFGSHRSYPADFNPRTDFKDPKFADRWWEVQKKEDRPENHEKAGTYDQPHENQPRYYTMYYIMRIENAPITRMTLGEVIDSSQVDTSQEIDSSADTVTATTRYEQLKQLLEAKNKQPIV